MALVKTLMVILALHVTQADNSVQDLQFWTKEDISAWHEYFPSRLLEQQRLTIQAALDAVDALYNNIGTDLAASVRYQAQELATAQFIMEGTSAQGCVNGIASFMDKAVNESAETFQDCVGDVPSKLRRLADSWLRISSSYNSSYQKALTGIDTCVRTYPNKDSLSRLTTCINTWSRNYFSAATSTTASLGGSGGAALGVFTAEVAPCAQTALSQVVAKGEKFLGMLVQCARLSENVDAVMYEEQLTSEFQEYVTSNDLTQQIRSAMFDNDLLVSAIEREMMYSYDLQKRALEKYVIQSRGRAYYYATLAGYVSKYFNTISSTQSDNPSNDDCVKQAYSSIYGSLENGASQALECDTQIVNDTKARLARVHDYFSRINRILPYTGGAALLSCVTEGYVFAERTVYDCYTVRLASYKLDLQQLNTVITADIRVLLGYEDSFFGNSSVPCGDSVLGRVYLDADSVLYTLQRCLYIDTGAKYAVTIAPSTETSTVTPTYTPTYTSTYYTYGPTTNPPSTAAPTTPWSMGAEYNG